MGDGLQDGEAAAGRGNGQGTALKTAPGGWGASPPTSTFEPEPASTSAGPPGPPAPRSLRHRLRSFFSFLPQGNKLDEAVFRKRHDLLCWILGLHVPVLFLFGVVQGYGVASTALEVSTPFFCLILARVARNRRLAAFFVTAGLVFCSSVLVHLSGGTIEAHFHFFVLIGLIALYQDWVPFLWNVLFTVLSHGLGSALASGSMFNHHAAQDHPWNWAIIHGVAVLAASVGVIIFWRSTELEQERSHRLALELAAADLAHAHAQASQRESISELFVNLARRNQSLLNRQLELIADLEQRERRPEELGELFKLDHLATRIRRNAESLLVLSGDDPPRRWGRPVPLGDVVRAAAAEVEDYRRVEVLVNDHLEVVGRAVADLAHMLAELIENATTFSPPGSEVRVRSHLAPGESSNYVLSIEDVGIGMSDADLIAANELLADPPDVDPRRSRLGFHVVSRLARRYGLVVTLASTPGGGVTAMVMLPADLVAERRPAITIGSGGAPPTGLNVYALPETSTTPAPPPGPDALASPGPGPAPGWRAAPTMPGVDPPPSEAWQAPPPIPPLRDPTGEGPAIPRETWEIAPSDEPLRPPVAPTAWQAPPPIAPVEPAAPADASIPAPAPGEGWQPVPTAPPTAPPAPPPDPSESLLRGRARRFRPSPNRWGPAPSPTPPAPEPPFETEPEPPVDADELVAPVESSIASPETEAVEAFENDLAEPVAGESDLAEPSVAESPEADEPALVDAEPEPVEAVEAEIDEADSDEAVPAEAFDEDDEDDDAALVEAALAGVDADEVEAGEIVDAEPADDELVVAKVPEDEVAAVDEPVEADVVELEPEIAAVDDDEPVDAEIVEDEAAVVEPVEPAEAERGGDIEAPAADHRGPWPQSLRFPQPQVPPPPPADLPPAPPVPPPPPFVVMPPVPAPPVDLPPASEVPAAAMMPPPPPEAPPAFEVAPSDEVARPFIDFGYPTDGRSDRPSFTGWPPTLRTQVDPSAVPAFLSQLPPPPPPPTDGPPARTADGLVKRVPGARLAAGLQSRSGNGGPPTGGFDPPKPDARRQHTSSMLSRFQAAQRDGRAAVEEPNEPPDPEEPS